VQRDLPSSESAIRELTPRSILLGIALALILGAANAYLGLYAGLTVSASIPAAVISMAILRILGGSTILENNVVQTIASAGEAVAAGAIFTFPALVILGGVRTLPYVEVTALCVVGATMGSLLVVFLRRAYVVEERLPFPEGVACAQVLRAGDAQANVRPLVIGGLISAALKLIVAERVTNLYLVPTLYHDLVHHAAFAASDISSVRKLGFAGAPMTDGLLKTLQAAFKPDLFVNHYGSSEVYTFTIEQNAPSKPGSAGRAGINQMVRVLRLGAKSVEELAAAGEEGEIVALLAGDESFEGYWRCPEADAKALRDGWYLTGDTGFFDADGDLFVTGRVDDMIITGGENVSPVEIESCLSLHSAVSEVAVAGLPDERWGKIVAAFIKRRATVEPDELDAFCRAAGLASFKRPRRYVFVAEIPKSPVGKLLRRKLIAGDYEAAPIASRQQGTAA